MRRNRLRAEGERPQNVWESGAQDRCIVCDRETNGKAICSDPNCAAELALG